MHKSQLIMLQKTRKNEEKMIHKAYYNISVQKLPIFLCHTRIWDTSMKIHQYFLLRHVILTSILITKTSLKNIFSHQNQNEFIWLSTRLLEFKTGILLSVVSQLSKLTDVSHHKGELSFVSKLRLQLIYDLWESCHKICGIIFHSENSNIISHERSRTNSFFAFKVRESD